nr:MAG TPA: hypothetical protein [Caudoviricetes sp.]
MNPRMRHGSQTARACRIKPTTHRIPGHGRVGRGAASTRV